MRARLIRALDASYMGLEEMNQKSLAALSLVILLLLISPQPSCAQSASNGFPHSMKGYELYSWKTRGQWYFSLVTGTNRQKTYLEVTSAKARVKGIEGLKRKLDLLSRGEEISWSTHLMRRMALPPRDIINEVVDYCRERGLVLRVDSRRHTASNNSLNRSAS
jgi:hypothetical protein